jgi:hypothetical protein
VPDHGLEKPPSCHVIPASARRPASVILTRVTSIGFVPAITRSADVVAKPVRTNATDCRAVNPCAIISASGQPSRQAIRARAVDQVGDGSGCGALRGSATNLNPSAGGAVTQFRKLGRTSDKRLSHFADMFPRVVVFAAIANFLAVAA